MKKIIDAMNYVLSILCVLACIAYWAIEIYIMIKDRIQRVKQEERKKGFDEGWDAAGGERSVIK